MRLLPAITLCLAACLLPLAQSQFFFAFEIPDENRAPADNVFDPNSFKFIPPSQLASQPPPFVRPAEPESTEAPRAARRQAVDSNQDTVSTAAQNQRQVFVRQLQPQSQQFPQSQQQSPFLTRDQLGPQPQPQFQDTFSSQQLRPRQQQPQRFAQPQQFAPQPQQFAPQPQRPAAQPQQFAPRNPQQFAPQQFAPQQFPAQQFPSQPAVPSQPLTFTQEQPHFRSSLTFGSAFTPEAQAQALSQPQPRPQQPAPRPAAVAPLPAIPQPDLPEAMRGVHFLTRPQTFSSQPQQQFPSQPQQADPNAAFRASFLESFLSQQQGQPRTPQTQHVQHQPQQPAQTQRFVQPQQPAQPQRFVQPQQPAQPQRFVQPQQPAPRPQPVAEEPQEQPQNGLTQAQLAALQFFSGQADPAQPQSFVPPPPPQPRPQPATEAPRVAPQSAPIVRQVVRRPQPAQAVRQPQPQQSFAQPRPLPPQPQQQPRQQARVQQPRPQPQPQPQAQPQDFPREQPQDFADSADFALPAPELSRLSGLSAERRQRERDQQAQAVRTQEQPQFQSQPAPQPQQQPRPAPQQQQQPRQRQPAPQAQAAPQSQGSSDFRANRGSLNQRGAVATQSQRQATTPRPQTASTFRPANLGIAALPADTDQDGIPGVAGKDYPTLVTIPETSFSCKNQPLSGYYSDTEAACQVVHFCQNGGVQDSFLCPNGTIFNQEKFSCQWWYEVNCADAPRFYILNDNLYRVPGQPEQPRGESANKKK